MTQEEKAKTYDEALKRAKAAVDIAADKDLVGGVVRTIFPELRESEDERIRMALIEGVRQIRCKGDVTQEQMLAYLERQKERGPLTKEEEYTLNRIIEYLEDETCPSEWISLLHDIYCLPYGKQKEPEDVSASTMIPSCWTEKQKEHAPIPDKFSGLKSLMLQYLQSAANRKDDAEIEDDTDLWGRKILDYVWKHTDMQKEQKPAQTVDEKEYIRTLKNLLSAFVCDKQPADVVYYQRVYDWLDGRHIEQKPAEWSEEDIDKMVYERARKSGTTKTEMHFYRQGIEDTLKSLRPSWKPSEEQMKALCSKLPIIKGRGDKVQDILQTLYDDLKKLGVKEEPEYYQHFDPDC